MAAHPRFTAEGCKGLCLRRVPRAAGSYVCSPSPACHSLIWAIDELQG